MRRLFFRADGTPREWWGVAVSVAVMFVATTSVLVAGVYALDRPACMAAGEQLGAEVRWGYWSGCLVQDGPGQPWVPIDDHRMGVHR